MNTPGSKHTASNIAADEALRCLREGNERFVAGKRSADNYLSQARLSEYVEGQSPFAVVLGCSDSRVPVEIVFDVGLGDLFVIRVAGNIVAPSLIGSVELAATLFGVHLVVVMGHTNCGAIATTVAAVRNPGCEESRNIASIVDWIRPSVEGALASNPQANDDELTNVAVRANVLSAAKSLRHGSELLESLIRDDKLTIVGAEYSLEAGLVEFFDGVP